MQAWGRRQVAVLLLIWLGWSALMLAYPVFVRARFEVKRPDYSLEWTGDNTGTHVIPDCGHWVQQERPDEVNALLLDFLDALRDMQPLLGGSATARGDVRSTAQPSRRRR